MANLTIRGLYEALCSRIDVVIFKNEEMKSGFEMCEVTSASSFTCVVDAEGNRIYPVKKIQWAYGTSMKQCTEIVHNLKSPLSYEEAVEAGMLDNC